MNFVLSMSIPYAKWKRVLLHARLSLTYVRSFLFFSLHVILRSRDGFYVPAEDEAHLEIVNFEKCARQNLIRIKFSPNVSF